MRIALVVLLLALAGCADSPAAPDEGGDMPAPTTSTTATSTAPAAQRPLPVTRDLFLTPDQGLAAAPVDGEVVVPGGWVKAGAGEVVEVLFTSEPLLATAIIAPGTYSAELWFRADGPLLGTGAFDFVVWGPASNAHVKSTVVNMPGPIAPGDPFPVTFQMEYDQAAPVVIPPSESFQLVVTATMEQEDTGNLKLVTGPDTPSRVNLTWTLLSTPFPSSTSEETLTGHIQSGAFPQETTPASAEHSINVSDEARLLDIRSSATGAQRVDIDLDLFDGGTLVMGSHSVDDTERIVLAGPALEPYLGKTLTLRVTNFFGQNVDYEIALATG